MLKIYLCTVEYSLQYGNQEEYLSTDTSFVIRDEAEAVEKTKEWGAYTAEARSAYNHICEWKQTKKGIKAIYNTSWYDDDVCVKEWLAPNAKLIANISYQEASCTAGHLLKLPATDVIAYLKQEGMSFQTHS
jgi:hypothetical protein